MKTELKESIINQFMHSTGADRSAAISWLEAEEYNLEDALMDYRAFHGIRTGR